MDENNKMKLIQKLKVFFSWKCPYRFECDFYKRENATCNGRNLGGSGFDYCGKFREINKGQITNKNYEHTIKQ